MGASAHSLVRDTGATRSVYLPSPDLGHAFPFEIGPHPDDLNLGRSLVIVLAVADGKGHAGIEAFGRFQRVDESFARQIFPDLLQRRLGHLARCVACEIIFRGAAGRKTIGIESSLELVAISN